MQQSVAQATEIVAYVTGTKRGRANQIARSLIDAGILPKSSGKTIEKIDAKGLLPLLAAVAMADTVAEAPRVASGFKTLRLQSAEKDEDSTPLAGVFAAVMNKQGVWISAEIEFAEVATGFIAKIKGVIRGKDGRPLPEVTLSFWSRRSWGHFCKRSFTVSAEGIEVMRNLFARDDIEGMSFSLATSVG